MRRVNSRLSRYVDKTNKALAVPPYQRTIEQKRLVRIVEKSPTYNAVMGSSDDNSNSGGNHDE